MSRIGNSIERKKISSYQRMRGEENRNGRKISTTAKTLKSKDCKVIDKIVSGRAFFLSGDFKLQ